MTALASPAPERVTMWETQIRGMLRAEFLAPVIVPDPADPILGVYQCGVRDCARAAIAMGICKSHRDRWVAAGSPELPGWVATVSPYLRGHQPMRGCAVADCRRGAVSGAVCVGHLRRWNSAGRPAMQGWILAEPPATKTGPGCRIPGCALLAESISVQLCRGHESRWREAGRPDLESFVRKCVNYGLPSFWLEKLPQPMRWEIAYALQCRVDEHRVKTDPRAIGAWITLLAARQWTSLLDRPAQAWLTDLVGSSRHRAAGAHFLHYTFRCLDDLRSGSGWEAEYPRDVWLLRRLGYVDPKPAALRFNDIIQPWLRAPAKRWLRWRLTTGLSLDTIHQDLAAMIRLSACIQEIEPNMPGIGRLDRSFVERFLAWISTQPLGFRSRGKQIANVGTFFRHVRQHGWEPQLPPTAAIWPEDLPRHRATLGRALSEYVMAQLENRASLALFAEPRYRLLTELLMRTGLRVSDACQLSSTCLFRDEQGAAYLRYTNHKMRREAFVPIDKDLADSIAEQQERVRFQWPQSPCLFPRSVANPDGDRPVQRSSYVAVLNRWLQAAAVVDENGEPVHVTPHQWRHTYGTRMINADVPQHVVKRLLDHSSDEMTAHYARLNHSTIRRHWEKAQRVDIYGQPVPVDAGSPLAEAQWLKESVGRVKMALANGLCTLPLQKSCDHANACLTCPLFVTTPEFLPDHRRQLLATQDLIADADGRGHARVAESNRTVERNLLRIISALETPVAPCCGRDSGPNCSCNREEHEVLDAG